jgi:hypothetical protein
MSRGALHWLAGKCATALSIIARPRLEPGLRTFTRQGYLARYDRLLSLWADRVSKRPYRTITWSSEFSPELKFVIPFAYWHHLNGTLARTVSSRGTKALYFFSRDHEERFNERRWNDFHFPEDIPNSEDHNFRYDFSRWAPVPWKEHYANPHFRFPSPPLVIANRYNTEWGGAPVSFLDTAALIALIERLSTRYTIIYNRPEARSIVNDESQVLDLNEKGTLRKRFPELVLLEDLMDHPQAPKGDFNALQLMVYANCAHFISTHGGTATLASCFGGTNIILSVQGQEHLFGEYDTIYPRLSGARIIALRDQQAVIERAFTEFLK